MNLFILDTNLDVVAIVDEYESIIWTERYDQYGDFELKLPVSAEALTYLKQDYYVENPEFEHLMIIEKILINSDVEKGNYLTVSGRSLESILDRRIVWGCQTISGTLQNGIKALLNSAFINPSDANRKVGNFVFKQSTDPAITGLRLTAQFTGDNLYDIVCYVCMELNLGFKITLSDDKKFVFELYAGKDRSYNQIENPYVVFSPKFENVLYSNYIESKIALKNITLVGGEGEGAARKFAVTGAGGVGLDRREMFTDARDISSDMGADEEPLSDSEYAALLVQRGNEGLVETIEVQSFEGEMDTVTMFVYGVDFNKGDIVQIANEYGHETASRVIEVIISENEEGRTVYPTFKTT